MIFDHNISPLLADFNGLSVRWYGALFAFGLVVNYLIAIWAFKRNKWPLAHLESVVVYLFFGLVLGSRLGHVIFYEPVYYWNHLSEVLQIWKGGLASHGGVIGVLVAYALWIKIHKVPFNKYLDALALGMPVTAACVRIGNFFNSEIVGYPTGEGSTSGTYGVIFRRLGENFPRHPAQLYEAAVLIAVFVAAFWVYRRGEGRKGRAHSPYFVTFFILLTYFTGRFFVEFFKDLHTLPKGFPLSMGQLLSLVPIALGVYYFARIYPKYK